MWEAYSYDVKGSGTQNPPKNLDKVILKQLQSKRGALYDQSGYPKLVNGHVKLVFASIYPLEKGFLFKRVKALPNPDSTTFINVSVARNFLLKLVTKYPKQRLNELRDGEYWKQFKEEYNYYFKSSTNGTGKKDVPVRKGSSHEIKKLINHPDFGLKDQLQFKDKGQYTILDGNNLPPASYEGDTVYTVLTVEGMGFITQNCGPESCYPLQLAPKSEILNRIKFIKEQTPIFFITFCHHFNNHVCGHARSFVRITKLVKMNQEEFLDRGLTALGMELLQNLLSISKDQDGTVHNAQDLGRRILVDMKHMSYNGRAAVIELVGKYNATHTDDKIPLIASHSGFTNLSERQMTRRLAIDEDEKNRELGLTQSVRVDIEDLGMEARYNSWSINLYKEEIKAIVDSDGLIGLSFEQNIVGIAFIGGKKGYKIKGKKKLKSKIEAVRNKYTQLIVGQLCAMAKAGGPGLWKCISIGTDFDGLIDPLDGFSSALCFELVRTELIKELGKIKPAVRGTYHLPTASEEIEELVDDFCFNNAARFVQIHFKSPMPVAHKLDPLSSP